ncbi:MAG: enoyl-CoA hydratase [Acidimicrobiia bacterium]|nr:enoyl-CoA hydratase [Acidimicrobiia bacterium]MDH5520343.1 enoyl-CoA hydratase [Acidimicrobiia bacterium]
MNLIDVTTADGVATITLNDPKRRNAVTLPMCHEIDEAMNTVEADESVNALIVTGNPPAFCAGADLSHLGDSAEEGLLTIYEGFLRIGRTPLPTIAAVNGAAVGAGMNLALICDLRLAGHSARFDTRFLDLGLHPGGGHTWMYQNICGPQTAVAAILFSQVFDGEEAARVGLAFQVYDDDELMGAAQAMAAKAGSAPRDLVLKTKRTMQDIRSVSTQRAAVDHELGPQAWSTRQAAFQDRLAKLKAKISSKS